MKLIWLGLILLLSNSCYAFDIREGDKQLHIAASAGLTLFITGTLVNNRVKKSTARIIGVSTTLLLGALKESLDSKFDRDDMKANIIGTSLGFCFTLAL